MCIVSVILLIIGMVLYATQRVQIGSFRAEGRAVKAAGVILTLPVMSTLLLVNVFMPGAVEAGSGVLIRTLIVIICLELSAVCAAGGIARILIFDPPGSPRLPGILGQIQRETRQQRVAWPRSRTTLDWPNVRLLIRRRNEAPVLTLKEAARYLHASEADILRLIEEGKLTSSRDHDTYKIARSQLDALRQQTPAPAR
jgi:excisionase family DNA binding protein